MFNTTMTRRHFIKGGSSLVAASALALTGCQSGSNSTGSSNPTPTNPTPSPLPTTLNIKRGEKKLVFIMLDGGNDSFNMLVPHSSSAYQSYSATRGNLAIAQNQLKPLADFEATDGTRFAVHPSAEPLQQLFAQKKLAFVANTGPLITQLNRNDFLNNSKPVPVGLMSHSDQFKHWQTADPLQRVDQGWFGKMADILQANKPIGQIPMNISLAGNNIIQNGDQISGYAINDQGSVGLAISRQQNVLERALFSGFNSLLEQTSGSSFDQNYLSIVRSAQAQHETFRNAIKDIQLNTNFPNTPLGKELAMVAKAIKAGPSMQMQQQTFFVRYIGWDHHDGLATKHPEMLQNLSRSLSSFQAALEELGVADQVVTFTGSDFGRALTSNGNGSDHGWGGHTLVMGNNVDGGKIYGDYPTLELNSELDAGGGIMIPTTAADQLFADLAIWFGVEQQGLPLLLPNISNFYDVRSSSKPIGLLRSYS